MKSKTLSLIVAAFLSSCLGLYAQTPFYPKPNTTAQIPFGKKLPAPSLSGRDVVMEKMYGKNNVKVPFTLFDSASKQFILSTPGSSTAQNISSHSHNSTSALQTSINTKHGSSGFHLTKNINTATLGSYPTNYAPNAVANFAVLNKVSYFEADDGIHGYELWRSDGTAAGTYLVKDIFPGEQSSDVRYIIAVNGLLYFSANSPDNGITVWVSNGTESGTHLLKTPYTGLDYCSPNQFVNVNGTVFFAASIGGTNNQLWKTDGTDAGTVMVKDIQQSGIGFGNIFELTSINDIAYFIAYTWASGYQLLRSDGTDAGTYVVKDIGYYNYDANAPTQLTAYNNKLYFSGNDGSGRKLWESDGTYDGTHYATGFNDVYLQADGVSTTSYTPFPVLNNVLYIAGYTYADGDGLYEYDASNTDGIVLVKDLTPGSDVDYIYPGEMRVVNDALYFKVVSNVGYPHDELWSSQGQTADTQPVKIFDVGAITYNYYNIGGTLYFVEHDDAYGNELWKSDGSDAGTIRVKDIIPGTGSSYPEDLTFSNGKLLFKATDNNHGTELFLSDGTDAGTTLVKDINLNGDGSNAGFLYKGVGALESNVLFNAFTPDLGGELYKSDGTTAGTVLLNDIWTGPNWSFPNAFQFKNDVSYFIDDDAINTAIYKTNGTTAGLQRVVAYIDRSIYYVVNFIVTDNGGIFYILGNKNTGGYELWHSDGTNASGIMLSSSLYYNDYVVTVGNTGYFVAGDFDHGYELWKSDGSIAGTKLVKDINVGYNGSYPYSLFVYKKDVYFGAYDGFGLNYALWKSDGTEKGTVKLKDITPATFFENFADPASQVFCVSNNTLYFTATDFNTYGAELWKTNGTEAGTKLVKDINPYYSSNPSDLTDVNGTLFFTADDGVHGTELWSTSGTEKSTKLVKDITPDYGSDLYNLCSAGGKLYFINRSTNPKTLWSSDGTTANTNQVNDVVVNGLSDISHLTHAGNKLFFGGYSLQYGAELYEGNAIATTFAATSVSSADVAIKTNNNLDVLLYPNPAHNTATLQIKGEAKNVEVSITDISSKIIWKSSQANTTQINLPVEKLSPGVYLVTIKNSTNSKTLRLLKE
jgi:ELWxxDGT repeat protein